jgi:hypothetical protein
VFVEVNDVFSKLSGIRTAFQNNKFWSSVQSRGWKISTASSEWQSCLLCRELLYPSSHEDREIKGGKESLQLTEAFVQPKSREYASASAKNISIPSYAVAPVLNGSPR